MPPVARPATRSWRKSAMVTFAYAWLYPSCPALEAGHPRLRVVTSRDAWHEAGAADGDAGLRVTSPSFGSRSVIFCLPLTTSAMKLMRSMSPLSSQVVSIRMPGSSFGVIVRPCSARPAPCGRTCPIFLVARFDRVDAGVALDAVVIGHVVEARVELVPELLDRRHRNIGREADMAAARRSRRRRRARSPSGRAAWSRRSAAL